jgi:hypothetical protein
MAIQQDVMLGSGKKMTKDLKSAIPPHNRTKYREPFLHSLTRNLMIALVVSLAVSLIFKSRHWGISGRLIAVNTLSILWISLGGHGVELLYLNAIRFFLPFNRALEAIVRLLVWHAGGLLLFFAMSVTQRAFQVPPIPPFTFYDGFIFIGIELIAHLALLLRGKDSFWNGRL